MIYYNGNYTKNKNIIPINDSGFATAIGIFDSMLSKNGTLIHGQDHYDRILFDAKNVIGIEPQLYFDEFEKICSTLLKENNLSNDYARIRTTVTGGEVSKPLEPSKDISILIHVVKTVAPDENTPVTATIITDYPRIAGCRLENSKRLDYSRSYAARRAAEEKGVTEAILINTNGNIACGATSNIFIKEGDTLITPPLSDGVLAGVTRKNILRDTPTAKEESISPNRLKQADAAFLTNSFFGMKPIKVNK